MAAKEKAKELMDKFKPYTVVWDYTNDTPLKYNARKECALICVQEMLTWL